MEPFKVTKDWSHCSSKEFWNEIALAEHVVQIYESDKVFLDLLHGFVSEGIDAGDCVVVIATVSHLQAIEKRLRASGFDLPKLEANRTYIPLHAESVLSEFVVNDWPDEELFNSVIGEIVSSSKTAGRQFRAFGEMVALLWANGFIGATVRLEHLWNKFCLTHNLRLFCAYPQSCFTEHGAEPLAHICRAHSKLVAGVSHSQTEVFYKAIEQG